MSAAPVVEEGIAQVLEHVAPDLRLVPDWAPTPDPPVAFPGLGNKSIWPDVFNWVGDNWHKVFHKGRTVDLVTGADVQQAVDAAVGETIKAMSGFIDQNAAMTIQGLQLLEDAIDNVYANHLHDYQELQHQIDALQNDNRMLTEWVVPGLQAQLAKANATAYAFALQAQRNAQEYARNEVFTPLYEQALQVQPAIERGITQAENASHADTLAQVSALAAAVGSAFNPVRASVRALETEAEDCVKPMCETMGPKTDLGKLLKGLKFAADAALLASLAALTEDQLVDLIRTLVGRAAGVIDNVDQMFFEGGKTLGETIASAVT